MFCDLFFPCNASPWSPFHVGRQFNLTLFKSPWYWIHHLLNRVATDRNLVYFQFHLCYCFVLWLETFSERPPMCAWLFLLGHHFGIVKGGNCQYPHHLNLKTTAILRRSCCMALGKKGKPHTRIFKTWGALEFPGMHKNTDTQFLPESTGGEHRRVLFVSADVDLGFFWTAPKCCPMCTAGALRRLPLSRGDLWL